MKAFPDKPLSKQDIYEIAKTYSRNDNEPLSGRMWGHIYSLGLPEDVIEVSMTLYNQFINKTMLDFTVYPSVLRFENDIIAMASSLLGGNEETVGNFTFGGTESIMVATKSARDYFLKRHSSVIPEILLPVTAHPAFNKASDYLGMKVTPVKIDPERTTVDLEDLKSKLKENTAMIVASAPNYPFGTIDDVKALSEIAQDKKLWLHVDSCIGGFLLPFLRDLGEPIPPFDLSLEGVTSISADLHKYGYAPRGASVVLFRNSSYREGSIFVMSRWPGYPIVNTSVLSTRSAGPLAAAWGIIHGLGKDGYRKLANRILNTRIKLTNELPKMGYRILGKPLGGIVSFTSEEFNLAELPTLMKGWFIQYQPGSRILGFPKSIHLTIAPGHDKVVDEFLRDLERATIELRGKRLTLPPLQDFNDLQSIARALGIEEGKLPSNPTLINELMHEMPPELVENVLKLVINEYVFRPSRS
ncbi:pyridoxal phosphate-dependent decarboxylase family protein [Sulfolobus acidocaldarius]|uniref:Decarboxylase n=4 Tax=Sulfolobus acidocaldarius TaxID=2285 RepID=Q4J9W7_SULAC|nr:aspartate aminotransferase family protein [Sulfolobus acidocaldarius]AAY80414.1 decarboxylase [Sulfolobus acidocaldarius DSM 639]AGE70997.1 decarboxylase [Sulfolobus acidocaldarius N8]AGE73268.1 decarboxylase [Sulfolobus acidocaldarius Ron12/I]ALU28705.1 decarboxylase [Sulfolobus acidocaldarius]ALU31423.1 decarboxylase [Sulfolobus acidocaldarius]